MNATCTLCGCGAALVGRQQVLTRHDVAYFQCAGCDLLFTERPHWLEEAYAQAISRFDTGAVERNLVSSAATR